MLICGHLDESPGNYTVCKKLISECYICVIHLFLKWHKYINEEYNSDCQGLIRGSGSEVGIAVKGQHEGSLWGWMCSVSLLYQCQRPGCNIVLQLCKILKLGKLGERHMESIIS